MGRADFLYRGFLSRLRFEPTPCQDNLLRKLSDFSVPLPPETIAALLSNRNAPLSLSCILAGCGTIEFTLTFTSGLPQAAQIHTRTSMHKQFLIFISLTVTFSHLLRKCLGIYLGRVYLAAESQSQLLGHLVYSILELVSYHHLHHHWKICTHLHMEGGPV